MYNFCQKKYTELSVYYSAFICSSASRCYAELMYSNIFKKKEYMNNMKNVFKEYYTNKFYSLEISKLRKMIIFLFKLSPNICSYIYKEVLKK